MYKLPQDEHDKPTFLFGNDARAQLINPEMVNYAHFSNEQDWDEIGIEHIGLESIVPDQKNSADFDNSSEYVSQLVMSKSDKLRILESLRIGAQSSDT